MPTPASIVLTGGGTGGHVFPALAVARVLRKQNHRLLFIGTREGIESRLVPEAGLEMDFIRSGALNRVGIRRQLETTLLLPTAITAAYRSLKRFRTQAVFSTGGFVAGPVMLAAVLARIPVVLMEPNAMPGLANRKMAKHVYRALLGLEAARSWFPAGKCEVTGLPVRSEFFALKPKSSGVFTLVITGGSRGARTLNRAARESWPIFRHAGFPVRIIHQTGIAEHAALAEKFAATKLDGAILPFIQDMAGTFAQADVVVSRAGGTVYEIAAAGMPSILVPLPFAADDHQRRNAEALVEAGAARMVLDSEFTGERLFKEVQALRNNPETLSQMRRLVRPFAKPGAAERAARILEEAAGV
jgi:UDP-N-acetylglucosamine--N-acetylmuramyl-(pentapeptide) pyrophosphoryl-undecaprenol N-acetylglucosamine transferase